MPVDLRNAQRRRLDTRRLKKDAEKLLEQAGRPDWILSVLLTSDREMATLHERWMREEGPTDVLSFPGDRRLALLGDIAISVDTAARCRPAAVYLEVRHYLIHGLLHLLGYDHRTVRQRDRMTAKARALSEALHAAA